MTHPANSQATASTTSATFTSSATSNPSPERTMGIRQVPSGTALMAATQRAVHQLLDQPLVFEDPYALSMIGTAQRTMVEHDPYAWNDSSARSARATLIARARIAQEQLEAAAASGVRQCVILGAGYDSTALRAPALAPDLQVFEVDAAPTQTQKLAHLREAGIHPGPQVHFVVHDFAYSGLTDALRDAGFEPDQPACVLWLGVAVYLAPAMVEACLQELGRLAQGSVLIFDYALAPERLSPLTRVIVEHVASLFAQRGEPWNSSFTPEDMHAMLTRAGFKQVDDLGAAEINPRLFHRRRDGLAMGEHFRIVCTRT